MESFASQLPVHFSYLELGEFSDNAYILNETAVQMALFGGRLLVKTGAEGVFCAALPETGLGIALKCDDGATRASETMMAAVIDALLPMSQNERSRFAERLLPPIVSRVGTKVGEIKPIDGLVAQLRGG